MKLKTLLRTAVVVVVALLFALMANLLQGKDL